MMWASPVSTVSCELMASKLEFSNSFMSLGRGAGLPGSSAAWGQEASPWASGPWGVGPHPQPSSQQVKPQKRHWGPPTALSTRGEEGSCHLRVASLGPAQPLPSFQVWSQAGGQLGTPSTQGCWFSLFLNTPHLDRRAQTTKMVTVGPRRNLTPAIPSNPTPDQGEEPGRLGQGPAVTWTRRSSLLQGLLPSAREETPRLCRCSLKVCRFLGSGGAPHGP